MERVKRAAKVVGWSLFTVAISVPMLAFASSGTRVYPGAMVIFGIGAIVGAVCGVIGLLMLLYALVMLALCKGGPALTASPPPPGPTAPPQRTLTTAEFIELTLSPGERLARAREAAEAEAARAAEIESIRKRADAANARLAAETEARRVPEGATPGAAERIPAPAPVSPIIQHASISPPDPAPPPASVAAPDPVPPALAPTARPPVSVDPDDIPTPRPTPALGRQPNPNPPPSESTLWSAPAPTAPTPLPVQVPPAGTPYAEWSLEALRDQLASTDYAAMGMALVGMEVPPEVIKQMDDLRAEISKREQART